MWDYQILFVFGIYGISVNIESVTQKSRRLFLNVLRFRLSVVFYNTNLVKQINQVILKLVLVLLSEGRCFRNVFNAF